MNIYEVIACIEKEGTWINRSYKTRDHVLFGDKNQEVKKIGVCWVASKKAIQEAIQQGVNFLITHENPFYQCSTQMASAAIVASEEKKKLLLEHNICVYRCHDVWDCIRDVGVSDTWAKRLGFPFEKREQSSYYQVATISEMSTEQVAKHVAACLLQDGEDGVYVFGDIHKKIRRIAIGTGAATNLYEMLDFSPDALIVSDDGINNYDAAQYAIDEHLPMIVVNHASCEIGGIKEMVPWLHKKTLCDIVYLSEGYDIHYYVVS